MKLNISLFIIFLIFSCNGKNGKIDSIDKIMNVDIQNVHGLNMNEIYDSVSYIPLELTDNSLLSSVDKLYKSDSCYIIFDSKQMNIFVFNLDGSFRCVIGEKGAGKDEYIYWNDIYYSQDERRVYAHERFQNRIYVYDTYGNLVLKTKESRYQFNSFVKTSLGFFVYSCFKKPYNMNGYNLILLDEELQESKKGYFPQKEFVNAIVYPAFFTFGSYDYFYYPSSNIVYKLGEEIEPYCKFDFGNRTMPYEEIVRLNSVETYKKIVSGHEYIGDIRSCLSNENWISFQFSETDFDKPVKTYYCMCNLKDEKVYVDTTPFINFGIYPFHRSLKFLNDEVGIYLLFPYILEKESLEILSKQVNVRLTEDSNPILVVCHLKKL
ncbi:6-bladed beta-propeller [Parabacteroides sp. AF48-14]|uniref:6-bladed beta-propeller n=1 Tax=Parabacteroides sp. AF48-14 TaxID=2292052 RepID=UPI000EFE32C7|nr:6-bladed beta-propeller [Parabacteroides sp. AF48-14]RHO71488.1 6-bladed beta-propeller [Parabacteroides sp. AF48-14]